MPANTTNQQITLPIGTDPADGPQAFIDQTADLETRLVQRFTTDADRAARNPTPATGELSIVAGNTWYDRYTGAIWLPATDIKVRKSATQTVNNSIALVNDTALLINFPAVAASWGFEGTIFYTSTTVADIQFAFAADAAITAYTFFPVGLATTATGVTGDATFQVTTVLGTGRAVGGASTNAGCLLNGRITTSGVAGVLQLMWAQNTLEATNTQVLAGSWLRLTAIA
jgi:hypothetical protein